MIAKEPAISPIVTMSQVVMQQPVRLFQKKRVGIPVLKLPCGCWAAGLAT